MLSLSMGWGIRGNFGHELGAMLPGALTGIAVCLMSGREDWQRRVLYFGFFGAIGWGFGASMSYMQVVSYAQSGHAASQLDGYYGLFVIGFLTAALGGACLAYPAVENRERLTAFFKPLILVLGLWIALQFVEDQLDFWYRRIFLNTAISDRVWFRQNRPFYWLDSNWLYALTALIGVCVYDLADRWGKGEETRQARWRELSAGAALPILGAVAGVAAQWALKQSGLLGPLLAFFVRPQGDPTAPIMDNSGNLLHFDPPLTAKDFPYNWPQLFFDLGPHLGWIFGALVGFAFYFRPYGKWRSGSALILYMALGWFIAFLGLPVMLSPLFAGIGGFRMTPPRGDNWAGALGLWLGLILWMKRNGLGAVNFASIVCGLLGGLGFMTTQFIKVMCCAPGNRAVTSDPTTLAKWAHWQSANWHSIIMEQGAGLLFGRNHFCECPGLHFCARDFRAGTTATAPELARAGRNALASNDAGVYVDLFAGDARGRPGLHRHRAIHLSWNGRGWEFADE